MDEPLLFRFEDDRSCFLAGDSPADSVLDVIIRPSPKNQATFHELIAAFAHDLFRFTADALGYGKFFVWELRISDTFS